MSTRNQKATISGRPSKFSSSHRKENAGLSKAFIVIQGKKEVAELRIYQPAGTVYACLWTHAAEYRSGSGSAGGGGYHKMSAAAGEAIRNAGFDLAYDIQGVGETAVQEALVAVAKAIGFPRAWVVTTHP